MITLDKERRIFKWLAAIVIIFLALEIIYYVLFLDTWFDEAEYGYKPWLVSQNLGQPFQDFRVKYPPLVFYLQTLFQGLFGPTVLGARILSALFLIGAAILLFSVSRRLWGKWAGLTALGLLAFNPYLVGFYVSAKDYVQAAFFPLLAIWFLAVDFKPRNKTILASVAMALAVLIRYNMIPALVGLWLYIIFRWRNYKYLTASILISLAVIIVALIPYLYLDPSYAAVWAIIMFGPLAKILPLDYFQNFPPPPASFNFDHLKFLIQNFAKYFYLWVIFLTGLVMGVRCWIQHGLKKFFASDHLLIFFFSLTIIFYLSHFVIPNEFATHPKFLYFATFMILSVTGAIALFFRQLPNQTAHKTILAVMLAVTIAFATVSVALTEPFIIFFNRFDYDDTDLNRVKRGGEYLRSLTKPGDKILAIGTPHHSFLAGRYEIPPLINGEFTYYEVNDIELLQRYKFYNFAMLMDWLKNEATVAVFQKDALPESSVFAEQNRVDQFMRVLDEKYELVGSMKNVYPRKYSRSGRMEIYRKKI